MNKDQKAIDGFLAGLKVEDQPTNEEFHQALLGAYMDRSTQVFFIWQKLKELYPEVDANRVIREGSWDFGIFQGEQIAKKYGGAENVGPKEALMGQSSKGGVMVFQQEVTELNDQKAVKIFHNCPHVQALERLGQDADTIKAFCRDMLGHCDYAICAPFHRVKIEFPTTIADGEGHGCAMTITAAE